MAYSIEIKETAISLMKDGISIKEIEESMGISMSTLYKWRKEISPTDTEKKYTISNRNTNKEKSIKIKELMKNGLLNEALKICERFPNDPVIQSQRISILIQQSKFEEALQICNDKKFKDFEPIQSQKISVLIRTGVLDDALQICTDERFENSVHIQSQRISILIKKGKYEEALQICERFPDDSKITDKKEFAIRGINKRKKKDKKSDSEEIKKELIDLLGRVLYNGNINDVLEKIQKNDSCTIIEKSILTLVVYLKFNLPRSREKWLKSIKNTMKSNDYKVLQQIINRYNEIHIIDYPQLEVFLNLPEGTIDRLKEELDSDINKDSKPKQEPKKQEPKKQEPMKQEPKKQESMKQESIGEEPIKEAPNRTKSFRKKLEVKESEKPKKTKQLIDPSDINRLEKLIRNERNKLGIKMSPENGNEKERSKAIKAWDSTDIILDAIKGYRSKDSENKPKYTFFLEKQIKKFKPYFDSLNVR